MFSFLSKVKTGNPQADLALTTLQIAAGLFGLAAVFVEASNGKAPPKGTTEIVTGILGMKG